MVFTCQSTGVPDFWIKYTKHFENVCPKIIFTGNVSLESWARDISDLRLSRGRAGETLISETHLKS
jgi:hypothetical protein